MKNFSTRRKLINLKSVFEDQPDQPDFSAMNLPSFPQKYFIYDDQVKLKKIHSERDFLYTNNQNNSHSEITKKQTVPIYLEKLKKEFHYEVKDHDKIKEHFKLIYVNRII